MSTPKVSVIVPVYNMEKYLEQCLDSIVNQTLQNIEIICVNDGSKDSSLKILQEYAQKDKRIEIINQSNKGVSISRNKAILKAKGKYIQFVDSDDCIIPETCETLYNQCEQNDLDMLCFGGYNFIANNDNRQDKTRQDTPHYSFRYLPIDWKKDVFNHTDCLDFINSMAVSTCLTFYKKSFIEKHEILFPPHLRFEDNVFFTSALIKAKRIAINKTEFYQRRLHSEQTTQNWDKYFSDYIKITDVLLTMLEKENVVVELYEKYRTSYLRRCKNINDKFDENTKNKYNHELNDLFVKYNYYPDIIRENNNIINSKNNLIKEKDLLIKEKDEAIKSKENVIKNKNIEIQTLKQQMSDLSGKLKKKKRKYKRYKRISMLLIVVLVLYFLANIVIR